MRGDNLLPLHYICWFVYMIVSLISKFSVKHQNFLNYFYIVQIYVRYDNRCYYTLHIFPLYESNKAIWMFYEKFADKGNNPMENPASIM